MGMNSLGLGLGLVLFSGDLEGHDGHQGPDGKIERRAGDLAGEAVHLLPLSRHSLLDVPVLNGAGRDPRLPELYVVLPDILDHAEVPGYTSTLRGNKFPQSPYAKPGTTVAN